MPKRYSLAAAYPLARVLRERDERIEQWHRVAAQDPNVMLLGDPPIERSALAQSTARREIGPKISLPRPLHQGSHPRITDSTNPKTRRGNDLRACLRD